MKAEFFDTTLLFIDPDTGEPVLSRKFKNVRDAKACLEGKIPDDLLKMVEGCRVSIEDADGVRTVITEAKKKRKRAA